MQIFETLAPDVHTLWSVNILIQVTVVSLLALLVVSFLRNNAVLRWWILGAALVLILASPATVLLTQSNGVGLFAISDPSEKISAAAAASVETAVTPIVVESFLPEVIETTPFIAEETAAVAQPPVASTSVVVTTVIRRAFVAFLLLWAVGVVWKFARMLSGWRQLNSIRRTATPIEGARIVRSLSQACEQLGLRRPPVLLQTNRVASPVAAGVFRPAILLPESLITKLEEGPLTDILRHEAAHVSRHDQVIVIAQNVVTCLFWIHPLVRIVNQRFAQAREEVCDNFVLHSTTAPSYSRTLLDLAEYVSDGDVLPAAVGMLDGWRLESRVTGLLQLDRNTATRLTRRSVVAVVTLFGCLLALGGLATISVSGDEPITDQIPPSVVAAAPIKKVVRDKPEKGAKSVTGRKALPNSTEFQFAGKVVGPDRQPVQGAKVCLARPNAKALAVSDAEGNFAFVYRKGRLPNNAAWGNIKLVAIADGFGIAISPILRFETTGKALQDLKARNPNKKFNFGERPRVLNLTPDDVPIQGQIVDLEGQPVPNVVIQLRFVNQAYARSVFAPVTTDPNGRFGIRGIGRDRTVRLVAKGERTEFSVFFARTKDVPTETKTTPRSDDPFDLPSLTEGTHRVTYGARLIHAIGPSVPVEGRVVDSKTGLPLKGVMLSAYQLASSNAAAPAREEFNAITDNDGRYRLVGLPLGSNTLRATLETETGYLPRRATFNVTDDVRVINGDLKITKGVVLSGRATDASTGEPLFGNVEYFAAQTNEHFKRGSLNSSAKTDEDGRYTMTVHPGEGYLTFRARNRVYPVGVLSEDIKAGLDFVGPFLPTKSGSLFPVSYSMIQSIAPQVEDVSASCEFSLTRYPIVKVSMVSLDGQPLNGANIEEVLILPALGFGRAANRIDLTGNTYQCQHFCPDATTAVVARDKERGLIGRVVISETQDAELPIIMKNPDDAAKVKIDRVRIDGDAELTLTMKPAGKISGRIVDKDGKPRVVRIDGPGRIFATNDDGTFEVPLVLPDYPMSARALHPRQQQLLGTLFSDVILEPGEIRDLGDIQVERNQP